MCQKKELKVAHLCCGIGGTALGFEEAGFKTVYANEIWPLHANTFENNFEIKVDVKNVEQINLDELPSFDVLTSSLPYVDFATEEIDIMRHPIYQGAYRIVEYSKPQVFCLEMLHSKRQNENKLQWLQDYLDKFNQLGYQIQTTIVSDRIEGGCPTHRSSWIAIGFLNEDQSNRFKGIEPNQETILINDCVDFTHQEDDNHYIEMYMKTGQRQQKIGELTPSPVGIYRIKKFHQSPDEWCSDDFVLVNNENGRVQMFGLDYRHINQVVRDEKGVRVLSIREKLNFKGFPTTFKIGNESKSFFENYREVSGQVSAAMCVPLAKQIAKAIKETF